MKRVIKVIVLLLYIYFFYNVFAVFMNVIVSAKYNAFSDDDVREIQNTLLFGLVLSAYSIFDNLIAIRREYNS
jgi:hypothetical protein